MTVKTKTKEYPINWMAVGSLDPQLRISLLSKNVVELASVFSDKSETETLINVFSDGKTLEYKGYSTITNISVMSDGTVIALKKENS